MTASKSCTANESLKRTNDHLDSKEQTTSSDGHSPKLSHKASEVVSCDSTVTEVCTEDADTTIPVDEEINFTVVYMKEKYDLSLSSTTTVAQLKELLGKSMAHNCEQTHDRVPCTESKVGVPAATQKLLYKGQPQAVTSLKDWGIKTGSKIILMGSRVKDIIDVQAPTTSDAKEETKGSEAVAKEPLSRQKPHAKIIEKGVPADAIVGLKNVRSPLPREPLQGMLNKSGGKVRLTFKLEVDQVWIGTKERTEKVNMQSIRAVVSEPIDGHEEYHMMALQLGPTEASRYWIYWLPAQYVHAIKSTILGD